MIGKLIRYLKHVQYMQRVNIGLARGAAASGLRAVDVTNPLSWEFSGLSQNGEDGIIDVLTSQLLKPNRYFIEIGASYGVENCTSWLAIARRYAGLMIDGDREASYWSRNIVSSLNGTVQCVCLFLDARTVRELERLSLYRDPDVLAIDIDGNDYHVVRAVLQAGFRPKVFVVEYNAVFGPSRSVTIEYRADFDVDRAHSSGLYYGVSVRAWRKLFDQFGYTFVTVESNGVNAFFIEPGEFDRAFVAGLRGLEYRDSQHQLTRHRQPWEARFATIAHMPLVEV